MNNRAALKFVHSAAWLLLGSVALSGCSYYGYGLRDAKSSWRERVDCRPLQVYEHPPEMVEHDVIELHESESIVAPSPDSR